MHPTQLEHADPAGIAAAIQSMWRMMAEPAQAEMALLRTAALTFVAVLESKDDLIGAMNAVAHVSQCHPARAVLVVPNAELAQGQTRSEVYMSCDDPKGGAKRTCSEQVAVFARPDEMHLLSQSLLGLFVEDMPRYAWWTGQLDHTSALAQRLIKAVDRVIIDTKNFETGALQRVAQILAQHPGTSLSDANWGRITKWREALAQMFESPGALENLARLTRVEIAFASGAGDGVPPSGLLLVGWLAERLKWTVAGGEAAEASSEGELLGAVAMKRTDSRIISIRFVGVARPLHERRIASARFYVEGTENAKYVIERSADMQSATLCIEAKGVKAVEKCTAMAPVPIGELLVREVNYVVRDAGYERAVRVAAEIEKAVTA
jgi:glucose-6-phosphate dehydrogenase assembly protein OpcA